MPGIWSTIAASAVHAGHRLLVPACLGCGARGDDLAIGASAALEPLDLCADCLADWPRAGPVRVAPFALAVCPWLYAWPVDQAIQSLKFRGERAWARVFGALLARERARDARTSWPDLVVPVPLHTGRLIERGYNQAADLARFAARALPLRCAPGALRRSRATHEQSALPAAQRSRNVAGAFEASSRLDGLRVALVDDVLTTGSTVRAAGAALAAAGASGLELWVVARSARRSVRKPSG